jgi:hypothetical protein
MLRASSIALLIAGFAAGAVLAQSNDDAAVFDASLVRFASEFGRSHKVEPKYLLFNETTVVLPQDLGYATKDLPKELLDAILTNNSVPQSIGKYSPPSPFRLSSARMLGPALRVARPGLVRPHYYNWELLRAQFPDVSGILEFAAPVYSSDGTSALVYFWTGCGDLWASGFVYVLEKANGTWKVVRTFSPWIA